MQNINRPTLLLDEQICKTNIEQMAEKARKNGLQFKPHMKTHQSAEIGRWIRNTGVKAITVSSLTMAEYFADQGWKDITIAFPCNVRNIDGINQLSDSISLTLLVNNLATARSLNEELTNKVKAYIEIDTGAHRAGLRTGQLSEIKKVIKSLEINPKTEWIGFYSHPGHSYKSRSRDEILQTHRSVLAQLQTLRAKLEPVFGTFEVCVGDTPCCSAATHFEGIDAISPGNFVFFDLMQHQIGCCKINDIAVAMICPVVDRYPDRNELIIYGGAIHFSKEHLRGQSGIHYGKVVSRTGNHWEIDDHYTCLKSLSQEHGVVKCSEAIFENYQVGDLISILPVHSCLTANLMKSYTLQNGKQIRQLPK